MLWPTGLVLCPFCRQASDALASIRQRARDLRVIAARQRRVTAEMIARSAGMRDPAVRPAAHPRDVVPAAADALERSHGQR